MDLGTRFGHDGLASPSERSARAETMKTKSVINHLRATGRHEQADELSGALLRRYAETKRAKGMKEEDIARRLRAIEGSVRDPENDRSSCVDFTDALMSFTSPTHRPPVPPLSLYTPPSSVGHSLNLAAKRYLYPSPTSPLHPPVYTPQKTGPSTITSPPSPALSNLITPPTPRIDLPVPVVIPPTPPTPTRPRRRRLKASISSIETITSVPRPRAPTPALSLPRVPSLLHSDEFNIDLFSPRPLIPDPSESFFSSNYFSAAQTSSARAGSRVSSILSGSDAEVWDERESQLLEAFPLPPPRSTQANPEDSNRDTPTPGPSRVTGSWSPLRTTDQSDRPSTVFPETPETIRPATRKHKPTRSMSLEDMWWEDESDAQTVTAATPRTERSSFLSEDSKWSARCEGRLGSMISPLACPSAASLIRDEYLKARLQDSRCSIESFSQGDPFIRATLRAMADHGGA